MSDDDLRARLCAAMRYEGDDWLEEAVARLEGDSRKREGQKVYDVSTVGLRVKCAREAAGLSQSQLALRLGVHPLRVCGWEKGREDIPAHRVMPLCTVLKIKKAWLTMESDEGGPNVRVEPMREHSPRWHAWQKAKRAWHEAQQEAVRRNEARKAMREAATGTKPPQPG